MCGIVGYCGGGDTRSVLIEGLKKLEYRGYDSAGLALQVKENLTIHKTAGSVAALERALPRDGTADSGIGHTRWATHGPPTDQNAHPHESCDGKIALVHNGIIENHRALRQELEADGRHHFSSETDTEVLAHLVEKYYEGDLLSAVRQALSRVEGSYALVVMTAHEPGLLVCARRDSPLVVGFGKGENFVASDIPALLHHTRHIFVLEDGEFALVTREKVSLFDAGGKTVPERKPLEVTWDISAAEKGGYDHFMLKEIMEQPEALRETMRQRVDAATGRVDLHSELSFSNEKLARLEKINLVACGTAYHAGLVGKQVIETLAGVPVEVDVASEFRYRSPLLGKNQLLVVISQSGETADTLAALRLARRKGLTTLAVTNVAGSTVAREADEVLLTRAGPEIAVASTKAYLTQLAALYLFALWLGRARSFKGPAGVEELPLRLLDLPNQVRAILAKERREALRAYCQSIFSWESAFFIGRGLDYPVALEGALKLKEVSYIHAEAYPAGELKHGPLALVVSGLPVIAMATQESVLDKTISNIQEVKARGGRVFAIARDGATDLESLADDIFSLPVVDDLLAPVLAAVPAQLIAYYTAVARDSEVDKPRNLAKSVTVE